MTGVHVNLDFSDPKAATGLFNPEDFFGKGWSIWKGPRDGDGLEGEEECDKRFKFLPKAVYLNSVEFITHEKRDNPTTGFQEIYLLKEFGYVPCGASAYLALVQDYVSCQDKAKSVLEMIYNKHHAHIDFCADILRCPEGCPYVLYLCRGDDNKWHWGSYRSLRDNWSWLNLFAVYK
jgi:hypothetical protein